MLTLVHKKDEDISVAFEKGCSITEAKNIVVLTDVISTGTTIKQSMEQIKKQLSPVKIFLGCVFCTNRKAVAELFDEYEAFCISDKFLFPTYTEDDINSQEELKNEFKMLESIRK